MAEKKDAAAVSLGAKGGAARWRGTTSEERRRIMSELGKASAQALGADGLKKRARKMIAGRRRKRRAEEGNE
jgi:hypothetical protein